MSRPLVQPSTPPPAAPPQKKGWYGFDKRTLAALNPFLAPLLITLILAFGHYYFKILEQYDSPGWLVQMTFGLVDSYSPTFVAIAVAILMELALGRLVTGKWPHLASAYISGISIGIIVRSPFLWPYILCSLIAITSKYAIRVGGRHIWNPSNLSISVLLFLIPEAVAPLAFQVGNDLWPILVIWLLGSLILWRLGRLHITLTYIVAFLLLAFVRHKWTGQPFETEVGPITGAVYQLFIFFMITDPKTTTLTRTRQCVVAALVAVVETLFRLGGDGGVQISLTGWFGPDFTRCYAFLSEVAIHAPYYALFVVGPTTNLMEIWWLRRQQRRLAAANPPAVPGP